MPDHTTALATLRRSTLVRDDSGPSRVYRDAAGTTYHSVTSILGATKDRSGLDNWAASMDRMYGPGAAIQDRNTAATRGTQAHSQAEYLLKTALRVARSTANKRNCLTTSIYGLPHIPADVWRWAVGRTLPRIPPVSFSASGYARSLVQWITTNVTACHACEFSASYPYGTLQGGAVVPFNGHPPCDGGLDTVGFAGTADSLISLSGSCLAAHGLPADTRAPFIADWKTSANRRSEATLHDYRLQCGAYSLALRHQTAIQAHGALIVVARRAGPADVYALTAEQLAEAERGFLARCELFFEAAARYAQNA